tara:strand:+ start:248 stop:652 length:405 start_codon:yes stop_codon:yes gene_type:complete
MKYKDGYKYQLAEDEVFENTNITLDESVQTKYLKLTKEGKLTIKAGYAWDGPSGPTYDSVNSIRASLAHDALYQLMRMGKISIDWRIDADILLENILEEDGMWGMRIWYWMRGVRWFAGGAAKKENAKKILTAP